MIPTTQSHTDVFISFATPDQSYVANLLTHLTQLTVHDGARITHRGSVTPGTDSALELRRALNEAAVVLLLLSADFLADTQCLDDMTLALERSNAQQVRVFPVLLRTCDLSATPLKDLLMLPIARVPIAHSPHPDNAWTEVVIFVRLFLPKPDARRARVDPLRREPPQDDARRPTQHPQFSLYGEVSSFHIRPPLATAAASGAPGSSRSLVLCQLILDISASMAGEGISRLNVSLRAFFSELRASAAALERVHLSIVALSTSPFVLYSFRPLGRGSIPILTAHGNTGTGQALDLALDIVEQHTALCHERGVAYSRPLITLLTDGNPMDRWQGPAQRLQDEETRGEIEFLTFAIKDANPLIYRPFSNEHAPIGVATYDYERILNWLSSNLIARAAGRGDEPLSPFL